MVCEPERATTELLIKIRVLSDTRELPYKKTINIINVETQAT